MLSIETTLSGKEYRLIRILRAIGNDNRYIIFKNLEKGPVYAADMNGPLKISRPALGKHVRSLINEGLVEQKHVVEGGTAKALYEITDFGTKIIGKIKSFTEDMEALSSEIKSELQEELLDINAQISSTKAILRGLEKRVKNKEISPQDCSSLKSDYDKKLDSLKKREKELKQRLDKK